MEEYKLALALVRRALDTARRTGLCELVLEIGLFDWLNSIRKESIFTSTARRSCAAGSLSTAGTGSQLSDFGDGKGVPDTIWYGLVQGFEEEWGYFSQAEIESLRPKTWEIPKKNLPYAGKRT